MVDIDWQYLKDIGKGLVLLAIFLLLILPGIALSLIVLLLLSPLILIGAMADWIERH